MTTTTEEAIKARQGEMQALAEVAAVFERNGIGWAGVVRVCAFHSDFAATQIEMAEEPDDELDEGEA